MNRPESGSPESPVTVRAVGLGLLAVITIGLLSAYNDCYLNNTYFIGNHFPVGAIVLIAFLVLGVNTAARKFLKVDGLSSGELLLIWGMVGLGGSLSSYSFVGYFPSFVAAPAYFATSSNEYPGYILKHIPEWMVVSKDPDSRALKWFMEGLPRGASIPWGAWTVPVIAWGGFVMILYASNFALCSVFFEQWSKRERLIFPLVQVPAEMARSAPKGRLLNDFFRNPLTWIGIAIPVIVWGINGLRAYAPGLPMIPTKWGTWGLFPDRPWNEFNLATAELFFSVVGITFLLTREVAFSFWFFFVAYRFSYVVSAWLGTAGKGFWGNWWTRTAVFETAGGMFAIAFFLVWTARKSLGEWLERAVTGVTDAAEDSIPPWLSLALIAGGFAVMVLWYVMAGAQWWVGVLAVGSFGVMLLVLTRVVAESGLLFLSGITEPFRFITGLLPSSWISGASLTTMAMQRGIINEDMRKIFMPYVINGMKAGEMGRIPMKKVIAALAIAAVVGLGIGTYGFIATSYKYGATNVEWWASVLAPKYYLDDAAKRQKSPPDFEMIQAGKSGVVPSNLAHLGVGAALAGGMLFIRTIFPWWPLHPFGFVMCATWSMSRIWFSILIGWAAKSCVMSFGGARVYRQVLPLFLGMALGECIMSVLWGVVGLLTGVPNINIVP